MQVIEKASYRKFNSLRNLLYKIQVIEKLTVENASYRKVMTIQNG